MRTCYFDNRYKDRERVETVSTLFNFGQVALRSRSRDLPLPGRYGRIDLIGQWLLRLDWCLRTLWSVFVTRGHFYSYISPVRILCVPACDFESQAVLQEALCCSTCKVGRESTLAAFFCIYRR